VTREIEVGGYIPIFIHPVEKVAAEKVTVMVEVLREHQLIVLHNNPFLIYSIEIPFVSKAGRLSK
jgi:hypothetical protein